VELIFPAIDDEAPLYMCAAAVDLCTKRTRHQPASIRHTATKPTNEGKRMRTRRTATTAWRNKGTPAVRFLVMRSAASFGMFLSLKNQVADVLSRPCLQINPVRFIKLLQLVRGSDHSNQVWTLCDAVTKRSRRERAQAEELQCNEGSVWNV